MVADNNGTQCTKKKSHMASNAIMMLIQQHKQVILWMSGEKLAGSDIWIKQTRKAYVMKMEP
jgi:hypothetical protein